MKKILLLLPVLFIFSCHEKKITKFIIGKDFSFDKFGRKTHTLYYGDGYINVSGSVFYSKKIGDSITIKEINIGN